MAFFRLKAPNPTSIGISGHPCDRYSRWRKFTFDRNDDHWHFAETLRITGTGPYTLYLNGVVRTVTDVVWAEKNETYNFNATHDYRLCGIEESVGGRLGIQLEDSTCAHAENPQVNVEGVGGLYTINLPDNLDIIDATWSTDEQFIMTSALNDPVCSTLPSIAEIEGERIFGRRSDGTWLMFDPRQNLETNTLTDPLSDSFPLVLKDAPTAIISPLADIATEYPNSSQLSP